MRLRRAHRTNGASLCTLVEQFTQDAAQVYTDEGRGYDQVDRSHQTVCLAQKEWAPEDDGDGLREVHIHTVEGSWTLVRNFRHLFRGLHKNFLVGYLAMGEFHITLKRIAPDFMAALVALHPQLT